MKKKRNWRNPKRSKNRRVKNATPTEFNGVKFRSKLEAFMYRLLLKDKFDFQYEGLKLVIVDKFEYRGEKIRAICSLPDFLVKINGETIIVETKGLVDAAFKVKLKLIKKYLVINNLNWRYFLPRNQKNCLEVIEQLKKIRDDR